MSSDKFDKIINDIIRMKEYYIGDDSEKFKNQILSCVMRKCSIDTIKFLVECGCQIGYEEIKAAIMGRNMDIIKYIQSKRDILEYNFDEFMLIAIKSKDLNLIKFLIEDVGIEETTETDLFTAIMCGEKDIISYVFIKSNPTDSSIEYMKSIGLLE